MSTTSTLVSAAADPGTQVLAAGINDWVQTKSKETIVTLQVVGSLIGVVAALVIAAKGRFSIGSGIMGIIVGGVIAWGTFGVTDVKDQVDQEMQTTNSGTTGVSAPAFPSTVVVPSGVHVQGL